MELKTFLPGCPQVFSFLNIMFRGIFFIGFRGIFESHKSTIKKRNCGPERSATQPKLYLGPEPVPMEYLAEDEWSVADVAKGTAEDLPCPRHSRATIERPTPRGRQSPNSPL